MKVSVKGHFRDLFAFKRLVPKRRKRILGAPDTPVTSDAVNALARSLHPEAMHLIIDDIRDETPTTKTFRLVADKAAGTTDLAFFRAGQYLSIKTAVEGIAISRPYSISSSPREALDGFYEITIRKKAGGFLTEHIWNTWQTGQTLVSSGPAGFFYYDTLRDTNHIVGFAGGSGITPFRSMLKDILDNDIDLSFTLLYGTRCADDIIFHHELKALARKAPERLKVVVVCSEPDESWKGPRGFLTKDTLRNHVGDVTDTTFFICGPPAMYAFLDTELAELQRPVKRIRREAYGDILDITRYDDFPRDVIETTFTLTVHMGRETREIPAAATESVLVAMERANLAPPSQCRSGECGFCRALLHTGTIYVVPGNDGRRAADKKFNYFHPCYAYPLSDLEITVPKTD